LQQTKNLSKKFNELLVKGSMAQRWPPLPFWVDFSQRAMMFTTTGAMGVASAIDPFQVVVSAIEGIDSLLIATTKFHAMDKICRSWDAKPQPPR